LEGRTITTRIGVREENTKFLEAAGEYSQEAIENLEDDPRRAAHGTPVPSAA
jgi:hypothetical protein